jgi:hypothetical protein
MYAPATILGALPLHFFRYAYLPEGHDQLVLREDNVKVTISLKKSSITFFKEQAKKQKTSYQKMIREVVDWYASHYQKSA